MNSTEFINLTFSRMHFICMSNSRKTTTASLLFFSLLHRAVHCIFWHFFLWTKGMEGTEGSLHISRVILERASFPMSVDFWYSQQGFHFALKCIWGSCAFQLNSMIMHPWRTWNLSKGTQTNVILLRTEDYLISVSHLLCQLFTRNVANFFCV